MRKINNNNRMRRKDRGREREGERAMKILKRSN
jgi:hypothetical protein